MAGMLEFVDSVLDRLEAGQSVVLATVVGPAELPRSMLGCRLVVARDGVEGSLGLASLDERVVGESRKPLGPRLLSIPLSAGEREWCRLASDVELELFLDPIVPPPTLLIAGGGHVALPLCRMGKELGFRVVLMDDRPDFASVERFPAADRVIAGSFAEELAGFPIDCTTFVVIVTRGHSSDEEVLRAVVDSDAAYIGMIGSRLKVRRTLDRLLEAGVSRERLERVHAPIGLDIGAVAPAEIAVSILAEIVHVKRRGGFHPSSMGCKVGKVRGRRNVPSTDEGGTVG
jgi:xanthine dehydrogenase accessory factor